MATNLKPRKAIQAIVPKGSSKRTGDAKDVDLLEEHLAYSPDDEVPRCGADC